MSYFFVGALRIELRPRAPKARILPLYYAPKFYYFYITAFPVKTEEGHSHSFLSNTRSAGDKTYSLSRLLATLHSGSRLATPLAHCFIPPTAPYSQVNESSRSRHAG